MKRLRMDITNRVNELCECSTNLDLDIWGLYDAIQKAGKPYTPARYKLIDDCLYIDGVFVDRFAPLAKPAYSEQSYYIEGLILSRSEVDF